MAFFGMLASFAYRKQDNLKHWRYTGVLNLKVLLSDQPELDDHEKVMND